MTDEIARKMQTNLDMVARPHIKSGPQLTRKRSLRVKACLGCLDEDAGARLY